MFISYVLSLLLTLFPKARAELLRILFAEEGRTFHLRELARLSGLTVGTLQVEVQKLCEAELLLSSRDGNRRYLKANAEHPVFNELHHLVIKTSGLRDVLFNALQDVAGIEAVFVFGSAAAGTSKANSDVDLMVIGKIGLRNISPLLRKASNKLEREINPVVYSSKEFIAKRSQNSFIQDVLNKPKLFIVGTEHELAGLG
ncbi:MAG: hypothetical protein SynsKO_42720 [Synoicihabitans sp.]